jgi:integrase
MRLRALCALRIDQHLLVLGARFVVYLPRELCKSGGPWEAPLPALLEAPMRIYLAEARPCLMSRSDAAHDRLWVGDRGQPVAQAHLSDRIARLTERSTGVRVRPHFFRDCATTTLARRSPDAARLIRPILGHSGYRTSERHYNHAEAIDAGRSYANLIGALRGAGE